MDFESEHWLTIASHRFKLTVGAGHGTHRIVPAGRGTADLVN